MGEGTVPSFTVFDRVRVREVGFFSRLFLAKGHKQLLGKVGHVIYVEVGRYSNKVFYAVSFGNGLDAKADCFTEDELELVAPAPAPAATGS